MMGFINKSLLLRNSASFVISRFKLDLRRNFNTAADLFENSDVQKYLKYVEAEYELIKTQPEPSELSTMFELIQQRKNIENDIQNLNSMSSENDQELKNLINEEKSSYLVKLDNISQKILTNILPPSDENRGVILEVTSGVGGKEAMLFAGEIYKMYEQYSVYKNWNWSVMDKDVPELGGIRHASALVEGKSVFQCLRQEAGIHRVQRVPETERSGRIHTSTCSVSVLPQPTDAEIVINSKDVKIVTKHSSGAGGQNVNKTESCVRLHHIPTGIIVESQTERFQHVNKQIAFQKLKNLLYQMQLKEINNEMKSKKKQQIGQKMRSDKIRTYNFPQSRITDHRIGFTTHNLPNFILGGELLDNLIGELVESEKRERLLDFVNMKIQSKEYKNVMEAKT